MSSDEIYGITSHGSIDFALLPCLLLIRDNTRNRFQSKHSAVSIENRARRRKNFNDYRFFDN